MLQKPTFCIGSKWCVYAQEKQLGKTEGLPKDIFCISWHDVKNLVVQRLIWFMQQDGEAESVIIWTLVKAFAFPKKALWRWCAIIISEHYPSTQTKTHISFWKKSVSRSHLQINSGVDL